MVHLPFIYWCLFLIWACSTYSVAGLPVEYQLEELKENYMELSQALADKERRLESLQQKNELLEGMFVKMAVEAKQQTTVGPILHLPDKKVENVLQEKRTTPVRFLEIQDSEMEEEQLRSNTTPVPIRSLNSNEKYLRVMQDERLAETTTFRPGQRIFEAIRRYLSNSLQDERTTAKPINPSDESLNLFEERSPSINNPVHLHSFTNSGGVKSVVDSKSKGIGPKPDYTVSKSVATTTPTSVIKVVVEPVVVESH